MNPLLNLALQLLPLIPSLITDIEQVIQEAKNDPKQQALLQDANKALDDLKPMFAAILPKL